MPAKTPPKAQHQKQHNPKNKTHMPQKLHQIAVPTPFNVGPVNVYLAEGHPLTLFDCGPRTTAAYDTLQAALKKLGYQFADIEQVVISHHHTDHLGLLHQVLEESQADLIAHVQTAPYLQNPQKARQHDLDFLLDVCREGGVPAEVMRLADKVVQSVDQLGNLPVMPTRLVQEGATIQTHDTTWTVYHTPGHSGDHITLFDPATRTLMAFDHLILKISSNPLIEPPLEQGQKRPQRLVEYMQHLQRMAALNPTLTYSGHGDPIHDVPSLVAERLAHHAKRADKILGYFNSGPATLWELTQRMFSHIQDTEKFLAISEVLGHVDILENEGKLRREIREGVVYWHSIHAYNV